MVFLCVLSLKIYAQVKKQSGQVQLPRQVVVGGGMLWFQVANVLDGTPLKTPGSQAGNPMGLLGPYASTLRSKARQQFCQSPRGQKECMLFERVFLSDEGWRRGAYGDRIAKNMFAYGVGIPVEMLCTLW